jgi:hypothetical protein
MPAFRAWGEKITLHMEGLQDFSGRGYEPAIV